MIIKVLYRKDYYMVKLFNTFDIDRFPNFIFNVFFFGL